MSPLDNSNDNSDGVHEKVPTGYEIRNDNSEDGEMYYVNVFTGVAWYTARDKFGRIYYYEVGMDELQD